MRPLRAWFAVSTIFVAACLVQAKQAAASSAAGDSLKKFLQNWTKDPHSDDDKRTRYFHAFVDLNGDGKTEAIVYLMGRDECGSGGCNTQILARDGASWKVVSDVTITRPPIRVLTSTSHGWHDLGVWVVGGGLLAGYEARLSFNGKSYPENPSVPPARRLNGKVPGEVVIHSIQGGTPLYP